MSQTPWISAKIPQRENYFGFCGEPGKLKATESHGDLWSALLQRHQRSAINFTVIKVHAHSSDLQVLLEATGRLHTLTDVLQLDAVNQLRFSKPALSATNSACVSSSNYN